MKFNKYMSDQRIKIKITTFQIIIYAFALTILMGSALLSLPVSTNDASGASFFDAHVYINLGCLRYRSRNKGYLELLVPVRKDRHTAFDPDRRAGDRNCPETRGRS